MKRIEIHLSDEEARGSIDIIAYGAGKFDVSIKSHSGVVVSKGSGLSKNDVRFLVGEAMEKYYN